MGPKPDFSGWATRSDIVCSDGRTIKDNAFKHQDKIRVPLVWQHQHNTPENVLGHAILENRQGGVYCYGYFNATDAATHISKSLVNGDLDSLSIYANGLRQSSKKEVLHGNITEVSLVLKGANEGAKIENVYIKHSDDHYEPIEDEGIIYSMLPLEHSDTQGDEQMPDLEHAEDQKKTVKEVLDTLTEEQKEAVYYMVGEALDENAEDDEDAEHGDKEGSSFSEEDLKEIIKHAYTEGAEEMARNVFDQTKGNGPADETVLAHADALEIATKSMSNLAKYGTLQESVLAHAQEYGIENIEILFPDAKAISNSPEIIGRRTEWVAEVLTKTKHSPFSRIKSTAVDLTADEARAKGYVKGNLKKEEIIKLLKRVTTPTTIYKKQKLDRDDIVDIVDFNVVVWLKAEMRLMLDEELARAVLIGDGRESDDEDKVDEDKIRPIAYDADMYAHQVVVASDLAPGEIVETVLRTRTYYKGTGTPTFFTTDAILTDLILEKDKVGRRLYETEQSLAAALRVDKIVTVEVMEDAPDIVGIIVNLADYTIGSDKGGEVNMFDDFDIDYNQQKYLIETRVSGALTKPKSAVVIKRTLGTVVSPVSPSYDGVTHTITIPSIAGVVYSIDGETVSGDVVISETTDVEARPATGYSFPPNTGRDWTFVYTA
ncbi:major capsid and protease fusion protein [Arthrobacter phage GoCrazy]|uniref:Major capsid and protease fusion protein n=4 Tax=Mudcatvirus TaxID=1982088 RepID=A0AAE9BRV1_9CAUD|nr:head maturation protease [Arthrobacter phage Arcadia]YP_010666395.1 head maturation protease [Arthrobacter phage Xenomorph]YP_010666791.1 head maturation protease [Arthrobacter phage Dynamite]YP_010666889.1 head maturation protease [Arthrobacter phage KeaneyLin]ASR80169.1 major capsid and protease fusion protein [Arthrobacter phage Elsa]ASR80366.1 major capsid and protease fusion protein [Arthrobacter phage Nason]QFP94980.1 major capsid and protease fusion protein [Arthrobacter phage Napol